MSDIYNVYVDYVRDDVITVTADTISEAEAKAEEIAKNRAKDGETVKITGFTIDM